METEQYFTLYSIYYKKCKNVCRFVDSKENLKDFEVSQL